MERGSGRASLLVTGTTTIVWLLGVVLAGGQTGPAQTGPAQTGPAQTRPAQRPPMAEEVFKNLQVLKGIPVNEFMETMGFFTASLGADCTFCHVAESGGSWERYADDNPHKRTAQDGADGVRHQSGQLRRTTGRDLLYVPSRR